MKKLGRSNWVFVLILFGIFCLRIPSLFEPFWYGDEGIFAAVARNLNFGGVLYQTAWDNKPPLIYLTYSTIFRYFGVSMLNIHLAATIAVLVCATAIYLIVKSSNGTRRGLLAMSLFGLMTTFRVFEGNLALTEIFMIALISIAMLLVIRKKFSFSSLFLAGILFGLGSLYKQVGVFEAAACGLYLFLITKNFKIFFIKGLFLSLGFLTPYIFTLLYFFRLQLVNEYIFAAYTYYRIYLNESPQYAILINVLKYSPVVLVLLFGLYKKKVKDVTVFNLFLLWLAFSFLGSYFSGRAYGHYMVQSLPALSIVLSTVHLRRLKRVGAIFWATIVITLLLLTRLLFSNIFIWNPYEQVRYYENFFELLAGHKTVDDYNNFFDRNVNSVMALNDFLRVNKAEGKVVYVWGDIAWLYAVSDVWNPSRYVTSFHVFGVPNGKEEVASDLINKTPVYIIKTPHSIGYFAQLEKLIARDYTLVSTIEGNEIYKRQVLNEINSNKTK